MSKSLPGHQFISVLPSVWQSVTWKHKMLFKAYVTFRGSAQSSFADIWHMRDLPWDGITTTTTVLLQGQHLSILRQGKQHRRERPTGCTWAGTAVLSLSHTFAKSEAKEAAWWEGGLGRTQIIIYLWIRSGGPQKPGIYKLGCLCNEKTLCEESD